MLPMPGPEVVALLQAFAVAFTRPAFAHAVVLLYGVILAPGRRTVADALRAVGLRVSRASRKSPPVASCRSSLMAN